MRTTAGGGFIVVLCNQFRDGLGELLAKRGAVRRRPEANLGVHRQGREAFARLMRTTNEVTHLADDPRAQGDEMLADSRSSSRFGSTAPGPRALGETT